VVARLSTQDRRKSRVSEIRFGAIGGVAQLPVQREQGGVAEFAHAERRVTAVRWEQGG
jgi:hypothetical protein